MKIKKILMKSKVAAVHVSEVSFKGMSLSSIKEETPKQIQNSLEGLYILFGPRTDRLCVGGAAECCWSGYLGFVPGPVASVTYMDMRQEIDPVSFFFFSNQ